MNSDPEKRPNSIEIITKLHEWLKIIGNMKIIENRKIIENKIIKSKSRIKKLFLKLLDIAESDIKNESGIENKSGIEHENDIKSACDIKNESIVENEGENRIRKQFLENDEISKTLPMITEKLNDTYTSKRYNISEIRRKFSKIASYIEIPNDI
ncbi:hypothetical protein C2G38_2141616 [Gigaspora rosea]|uniref:Uncharacterized protein n=1 Tax=Gigaspora rosea TaxID=44941 RepID=A0A397VAM2_9GLOM|nr:hypothetical protein C2G38_2141616 [Gigaspora rosea]